MFRSIPVVLCLVLLLAGCGGASAGGTCSEEGGGVCSNETTALICQDGRFVSFPCRGEAGCVSTACGSSAASRR